MASRFESAIGLNRERRLEFALSYLWFSPPRKRYELCSILSHHYVKGKRENYNIIAVVTSEHEMIPTEGRVWRGAGAPDYCGSVGRLLVGAPDSSTTPQAENIRHFEYPIVSVCTERMLSGWVVATRHSP